LIRYRRSLIDERAREVNRIQKVLEGANIKLSSVASDVLGKSGRAMIEAMIAGEENPELLSELAQRRLKNKKAELQRALNGLIGNHQKLMLAAQLRHIDYLDEEIGRLDEEIKRRMLPFEEDLELLDTIPGVARRTAETIAAEGQRTVQRKIDRHTGRVRAKGVISVRDERCQSRRFQQRLERHQRHASSVLPAVWTTRFDCFLTVCRSTTVHIYFPSLSCRILPVTMVIPTFCLFKYCITCQV